MTTDYDMLLEEYILMKKEYRKVVKYIEDKIKELKNLEKIYEENGLFHDASRRQSARWELEDVLELLKGRKE